eukprot:359021-Chlamydomonas_euryale.AAC.4
MGNKGGGGRCGRRASHSPCIVRVRFFCSRAGQLSVHSLQAKRGDVDLALVGGAGCERSARAERPQARGVDVWCGEATVTSVWMVRRRGMATAPLRRALTSGPCFDLRARL